MPCFHPLPAWRTDDGQITLSKAMKRDDHSLYLPCGKCLGCNKAHARAWALRCHLELQQHAHAAFTTLTYDQAHLPPTLHKRDLQLYLKRLRYSTDRAIRFFASGEYGEECGRPHYHALLFGLSNRDHAGEIEKAWTSPATGRLQGLVRTYDVTPAAIAYVAGYTAKKWTDRFYAAAANADRTKQIFTDGTGFYRWQPPFLQMSRGGRTGVGIGGITRDKYASSWRDFVHENGSKMHVPRYLHEAWKAVATSEQQEQLEQEKYELSLKHRKPTETELLAAEEQAATLQRLTAARRKLH